MRVTSRIEALACYLLDGLGEAVVESRVEPDSAFIAAASADLRVSIELYFDDGYTLRACVVGYCDSQITSHCTIQDPTYDLLAVVRDLLTPESTP